MTSSLKEAALAYASWGWPVLPCHWSEGGTCSCGDPACRSPGKHPYSRLVPRGLHQASTDPLVVGAWWDAEPRANVAIRTGGASRLCVIDVDPRHDGDETLAEWERTHGRLPSTIEALTGGGGRHLYLTIPEGLAVASGTNRLGPGVDVRADGGYVLAPRSAHVSGRCYEWEMSGDPEEGTPPAEMPPPLVAALAERPAPPTPEDAETVRLRPDQVAEIRRALAYVPADDRDTWLQAGMALQSTRAGEQAYGLWTEWAQTSEKFDSRDQRRVWRSLRADHGLTLSTLYWMAQGSGYVSVAPCAPPALASSVEVIAEPFDEEAPTEHADSVPPPPDHLLTVPGVLGEFVAWANRTSYRPQPQFAVQAALSLGSVALGRGWVTDRRNWPALYLLNVGPSGCGKEHAKSCIEQTLHAAGHLGLVNGSGYTSRGAVFSALRDRPCHLTVVDEFGMFLESIKAQGNHHRADVVGDLMEAFGRCHGLMSPPGYSTMGTTQEQRERLRVEPIWCPSITLLGMTTPRAFFSALTSDAVRNGFLNRLLIVQSAWGRVAAVDAPESPPPNAVVDWVSRVREPAGNLPTGDVGTLQPSPRVVPFAAEAAAMLRDLDDEVIAWQQRVQGAGLDDLLVRVRELAMRVALIVAVSCSPRQPVIRAEYLGWAREYVVWYAEQMLAAVQAHVSDSKFDAMVKDILQGLRARGAAGVSGKVMARYAPFSKYDRRDRTRALEALAEAGLVVGREVPTGPQGGRPSVVWMATK